MYSNLTPPSSPAEWCQAFFILSSALVLAVAALPSTVRSRLMDYGARSHSKSQSEAGPPDDDSIFVKLIITLTSFGQVSHAWFIGFYLTSLGCSIFWLFQYLSNGNILHLLTEQQAVSLEQTMDLAQVGLVWAMTFLQASRRFYEHVFIIRPSGSKMWIVHFLLGVCFYMCLSVSLWIEGSDAILGGQASSSIDGLHWAKIFAGISAFLVGWINQHRCHVYLAGLKKYSLPDQGMFRHFVCPHYTCECLIYLSLAVAAAPQGAWYNKTLVCALGFVVVNLGVTAAGTRKWYADKFGPERIEHRWNMVPFMF